MTNKTALQIFCENLEHNMSIETFSFYNLLKRDCLELEKQQTIEGFGKAIGLISNLQISNDRQEQLFSSVICILEQLKNEL